MVVKTHKGAGAQAEAEKETSTLDSSTESGDNDQAQLNSGTDDDHLPTFQPSNFPTLQLTPDHPVYVEGKGWLGPKLVYNFTVKGPHTYFVLEVGVLAHNAGCGPAER